jgi:spore maturation protein CgeB
VIFIGAPYDQRAQFIVDLWEKYGIRTKIWGDPRMWRKALPGRARADFCPSGLLWNKDYREAIWKARICLSFVTHANCDITAGRTYEITASGGFTLAEDTTGHRDSFVDGEEVVLFSSLEDCAKKIRRYLPDEAARARIARAGCRRALSSGYSNDARIAAALDYVAARISSKWRHASAPLADPPVTERQRKILYVGALRATATSLHRCRALERIGHEVIAFDTDPYMNRGGFLTRKIRIRTLIGTAIADLNRDLFEQASRQRPDIVWFDKATSVWARTVRRIREQGAFTVHYNGDNPFGPRRDPGWRLFRTALPEYDLHVVPRESNIREYRQAGANDVLEMRFSYEPNIHFPPPDGWSDADRTEDVIFIGAPYDRRADFICALWQRHGIRTKIWGDQRMWQRALPKKAWAEFAPPGLLWDDDYRKAVWRARICLSFVTHSNCDEVARRSFEIAACGGFMLLEDTRGHRETFKEFDESLFFHSVDDCAEKIRRYLPDEAARTRISREFADCSKRNHFDNDSRLRRVMNYIEEII